MRWTLTRFSESTWTIPLVALLLVGMLTAFYAVVRNAAKTGDLRRSAIATQAAAVNRCNALPGWHLGKACRRDLDIQADKQASIVLAAQQP